MRAFVVVSARVCVCVCVCVCVRLYVYVCVRAHMYAGIHKSGANQGQLEAFRWRKGAAVTGAEGTLSMQHTHAHTSTQTGTLTRAPPPPTQVCVVRLTLLPSPTPIIPGATTLKGSLAEKEARWALCAHPPPSSCWELKPHQAQSKRQWPRDPFADSRLSQTQGSSPGTLEHIPVAWVGPGQQPLTDLEDGRGGQQELAAGRQLWQVAAQRGADALRLCLQAMRGGSHVRQRQLPCLLQNLDLCTRAGTQCVCV